MKVEKAMKRKLTATAAISAFLVVLGITVASPAQAGILLYDDLNFGGAHLGDFGTGTSWVGSGANDRASSIKVESPANYAILWDGVNYGYPRSDTFWDDVSWLGAYSFNDITSSIS